jgi:hypothetical protein
VKAVVLVAVLLLVGCGGHKKMLPPVAPAYPGATDAQTSTTGSYSTTDWSLPQGTRDTAVYDWYVAKLSRLGWKITQRNETGLHAEKGNSTLDVGVRGTTLEVNKG